MTVSEVRRLALALPGAAEAPHFDFASFRVSGKIYATMPPDEQHLHVFVDEPCRETMVALHPAWCEPLLWGGKVMGVRLALKRAKAADVKTMLENAWRRKAPKRLL